MSAQQQILAGIKGVVPPSNTVAPVITGIAVVGQTLSCSTGSWAGTNPSFTYQWQRGTTNISGKTSSTYLVEAAYVGETLRCVVTATNSAGSASANSASTAAVQTAPGQALITSTQNWVCPAGVTSVSVVCVNTGDPGTGPDSYVGGRGGSLAYVNNFPVVPGNSYAAQVGSVTYFHNTTTVKASTGVSVGTGGGLGGTGSSFSGGGGAGGYNGSGGNALGITGGNGSGGGGGGGGELYGGGGGVGLMGQGSNGTGGNQYMSGTGGSGGATGTGKSGGIYGGGGAGAGEGVGQGGNGGAGAIRIIWPGTTRQFPSTNTTDM